MAQYRAIEELAQDTPVTDWLERLDEVLLLKEDVNDRKKVGHLLSNIGQYGYSVLKSLTAPAAPNTKTYKELNDMLIDHLDPKPTVVAERYRFHKLQQGSMTVAEFRAKLRVVAGRCNFGTFSEDAMRDQFIFGLTDDATRRILLAEENISGNDAYKKALLREQAHEDNKLFSSNKVNQVKTGWNQSTSSNQNVSSPKYKRFVCAKCELSTGKCRPNFCTTECFNCSAKGHSSKICPLKSNSRPRKFKPYKKSKVHYVDVDVQDDENFEHEYEFINYIEVTEKFVDPVIENISNTCFNISEVNEKPILKIIVENEVINFELDTGSAITCINLELFNNLYSDHLRLTPSEKSIRVANGSTIDSVSVCYVNIKFRSARFHDTLLYVVSGPFPSLLGRDWMRLFWGDSWLNQIVGQPVHKGNSQDRKDVTGYGCTPVQVSSIPGKDCIDTTPVLTDKIPGDYLNSYSLGDSESIVKRLEKVKNSSVFDPGLGKIKGYEGSLQLKENHRPVFKKARSTAYAVKNQI